jgi:uncharacterized protein YjiS (DUF1127 family)
MDHITNIRLSNQSESTIFLTSEHGTGLRTTRRPRRAAGTGCANGVDVMSTFYSDYASETRVSGSGARFLGESAAARFAAGVKHILLWPARVLAARRELEMLAGMSEYELKDIGLTSADIADVTALPADVSPTDFLAGRVDERHRAARHG